MKQLQSRRAFCLIVGLVLFGIGITGYAFRSSSQIPDWYLLLNIAFGFWGILLAVNGKE